MYRINYSENYISWLCNSNIRNNLTIANGKVKESEKHQDTLTKTHLKVNTKKSL